MFCININQGGSSMQESKSKKFIKTSIKPIVVGVIAALLGIVDSLVAPLFVAGANFIWVAFVNWTAFFGASINERLRAIAGYVIGILSAIAIVKLGNWVGAILAILIVNTVVVYFEHAKKLFIDSIPGIFIGIALTFSGAGVGLSVDSPTLWGIIIVYGIFGLLCGIGTNYFSKKLSSILEKRNK